MSQPTELSCNVDLPGELDASLGEFWEGNPWKIFMEHNLSSFEKNRVFLNAGDRSFIDVSYVSGADSDSDSRASIPLDFNSDGRQDLLVRNVGGGALKLYRNEFAGDGWLRVRLRGVKSNSLGVGARLTLKHGDSVLVRDCFPANSFLSQRPSSIHFGLGGDNEARTTDDIEVRVEWPSGTVQTVSQLPANSYVVITEGEREALPAFGEFAK